LIRLYRTINSPAKAGRVWATYSREQADAMLDVVKQMLELRGFEFERKRK